LMSRGAIEKVVDRLTPEVVLGDGGVGEKKTNLLVQAFRTGIGKALGLIRSIDPITDRERAAITIERNLEVEAESESTLITVQYDAENPELAQLVTQTLVDVYREEHMRMHRTTGSKEFFTTQHDQLKCQLDDVMEKLRVTKNRLDITSVEARRNTLEARFANIELSLYSNLQHLAATRAKVADLKTKLVATPARIIAEETTVPNTGTDSLREQVFELQVLMLEQQSKYSDDHPALKVTREQLAEAQAMLKAEALDRQETTNDINPNYSALALSLANEESTLAGFAAQQKKLNEQLVTTQADLKEINDHEIEIDQLNRASHLARNNYLRYADKLEKARIDEELDRNLISNAIKAQEATLAEKPISPSKLLIGALASMLSLFSVVSLVLISEKLSTPIYKAEQLQETLPIPVFGVLPDHQQNMKTIA
ncbi:MAG: GumC family protein, partial [Bythopirellula sp.]